MKTIYVFLVAVSVIVISCGEQNNSLRPTSFEVFADSIFQTSVDSAYIAGASVIVYQKGEKLLDKSYGLASLELSAPIPEDGIFEIGSVTKQFTSVAILKLVEEGKISLDEDFTTYLDFDTRGRVIPVSMLLNHTSGIISYTAMPEFGELVRQSYERDTLVSIIEKEEFVYEPGEALIYNNSAYFFLGLIIEEVTGMSYEEYLSKEIFEPLGMNNTYYCSNSDIQPNKVYGYGYSRVGLKQKSYLDHTWPYAAGSLCSTTEDVLIWMKALHNGEVLNDELYSLLTTPGSLNDGSELRYAMGITNFLNYGHRDIGHGGGINGFLTDTRYFPDDDLYVICLVNTTGPKGAAFFARELTWQILQKNEVEAIPIDIDSQVLLGSYTGQARGRELTVEVSFLDNSLILLPEGRDEADTVDTYIGNHTWMDGNDIIIINNDRFIIDQVSGHFVLHKQ